MSGSSLKVSTCILYSCSGFSGKWTQVEASTSCLQLLPTWTPAFRGFKIASMLLSTSHSLTQKDCSPSFMLRVVGTFFFFGDVLLVGNLGSLRVLVHSQFTEWSLQTCVRLQWLVAPTDLVNPDAHQWLVLQWKTVVSATSLTIWTIRAPRHTTANVRHTAKHTKTCLLPPWPYISNYCSRNKPHSEYVPLYSKYCLRNMLTLSCYGHELTLFRDIPASDSLSLDAPSLGSGAEKPTEG